MAVRRKTKIDPGGIYTAYDGFSGTLDGAPTNVRAGTKLLGSHPVVQAYPAQFVGPNADDAAVQEAKREAYAQAFAERNESRNTDPDPSMVAKPIPPEHRLIVTRDHIARTTEHGIVLHAGEIVDARGHDVKVLLKIDKTLFRKPAKEHA